MGEGPDFKENVLSQLDKWKRTSLFTYILRQTDIEQALVKC